MRIRALPIEAGQTISQPYIVARMIELAEIKPGDKVLEVGAGSGYAAAVMSRMASKVYAIERHAELAALAARAAEAARLHQCRDHLRRRHQGPARAGAVRRHHRLGRRPAGARGLEASARAEWHGSSSPSARHGYQTLIRVRRTGEDSFEEEDFGAVTFVPLIGEEGWPEPEPPRKRRSMRKTSGFAAGLLVPAKRAQGDPDEPEPAHRRGGGALRRSRTSCASWSSASPTAAWCCSARRRTAPPSSTRRARASPRCWSTQHGFNIVAVEADWPDAAVYDAYVRGLPRPAVPKHRLHALPHLDVAQRAGGGVPAPAQGHQRQIAEPERKAGFYGLDIYSLGASIEAVLAYLDRVDPEAARTARERYGCLAPWRAEPARYGRMALSRGYAVCEKPVTDALIALLRKRLDYLIKDGEAFFDAEQNARIVAGRRAILPRHLLWRRRVVEPARRAYVRDARAPARPSRAGRQGRRVGAQLPYRQCRVHRDGPGARRAQYRPAGAPAASATTARSIGFGTDRGTVAAASDWDGPMEIKRVRPARDDSYEGRSRDTGIAGLLPRDRPRAKGRRSARRWPSPCSSAPSASSTGPKASSCPTISRPSCRGNSMPGSGSRRPRRWRRGPRPTRTVPTRPIPSGSSAARLPLLSLPFCNGFIAARSVLWAMAELERAMAMGKGWLAFLLVAALAGAGGYYYWQQRAAAARHPDRRGLTAATCAASSRPPAR